MGGGGGGQKDDIDIGRRNSYHPTTREAEYFWDPFECPYTLSEGSTSRYVSSSKYQSYLARHCHHYDLTSVFSPSQVGLGNPALCSKSLISFFTQPQLTLLTISTLILEKHVFSPAAPSKSSGTSGMHFLWAAPALAPACGKQPSWLSLNSLGIAQPQYNYLS